MTTHDPLLLLLVFTPLLAALAVPWLGRRSELLRDGWVMLVNGAVLVGTVALALRVLATGRLGAGLPLLVGRLEFVADPVGALFALFSAFVWFCATLYSLAYMKTQRARDRYQAVSLVVLGAMLGVVLAGELVTLFLFFETLGLVAFLLVVHTGTPEARRAAIQYFWMTVLGGIALLSGIMMVHAMGGGTLLPAPPLGEGYRAAAAALMVLGFGVKAGMVPVHFWLPNAHPVAPSPASALLSGVMIKAGAYGIFRSVSALFTPAQGTDFADAAWAFSAQLGLVVTWIGIITMLVGVVLALGQSNAKRMLAYHSISQMGFILAGVGAGALLLGEGAMGTAGGLMHAVNHALFKASLFLGVGAVAFRAGSLDMYALGGLWRRMPLTFGLMLVAAAGITGLPLFNGFVSKSMIHHALEAAYADAASLRVAERIFILTAAGTAASFIKLIGLVFLGPSKLERPQEVREAPRAMLIAMGLLSVPVIVLGWRPQLVLEGLLAAGLQDGGTPAGGIAYYLEHYFLSPGDVVMSLLVFALGGVIFAVGMKFGLFHLQVPDWLSLTGWFGRAGHGLAAALGRGAVGVRGGPPRAGEHIMDALQGVSHGYEQAQRQGRTGEFLMVALRGVSRSYERAQKQGGGLLGELLLALFQGVTLVYGRIQHRVAWSLRTGRRRLLLGLGDAGRARRQLVDSLLVGLPGSPAQAFLEAAWGACEQDRHATVRAAVAGARREMDAARALDDEQREARIEAVRSLAGMMAGAVFDARLERLGELARGRGVDAMRAGFAALHRQFEPHREAVSTAAVELAERRSRGEEIVREVSRRLQRLLEQEARAVATAAAAPRTMPAELPTAPVRAARRRREAFGAWLRDMARLAVVELRQHPSSWPQSESLDTEPSVVSTRRGIQRYARDVALNIAAIFLVMLLLAAALWLGA
jgi:formate hydrogenlyase subunit 3/multisubunit Na+/H+ antiporter MnhD subunit